MRGELLLEAYIPGGITGNDDDEFLVKILLLFLPAVKSFAKTQHISNNAWWQKPLKPGVTTVRSP